MEGFNDSIWSVTLKRDVTTWGVNFTEHWTYKSRKDSEFYKLRVVGPNGEVCRDDEIPTSEAPVGVREGFENIFREASRSA